MSKKRRNRRQWEHTPEEILRELVSMCQQKGRVVSQRAVKKDPFLDYEEVIGLLGQHGGWPEVEERLRKRLEELDAARWGEMQKAELCTGRAEVEEVDQSIEVERPMSDEELMGVKKRRGYTTGDLLVALRQIKDYLGRMPQVADFARLRNEGWEIPTYATFVRYLGKKSQWDELLQKNEI